MFNIFNSNVFVEIGEAIGNVGKRLLSRGSHAETLDQAFRRALQDPLPLHLRLPNQAEKPVKPEEIVIEGSFRVLDEEEES
jgi:hypothetical protein